jgi:hypothetical protein
VEILILYPVRIAIKGIDISRISLNSILKPKLENNRDSNKNI